MPLALTNLPTAWVVFDGSTTANLIAGITAALQATGWSSGLVGTSPQGLTVTLTMAVVDASNISLTMSSASGSGVAHRLHIATNYQIWSNCCSFFISQPNLRWDGYPAAPTGNGTVVVAGIPWTPPATCGGVTDAEVATEAWYCFGDWLPAKSGFSKPFSGNPRTRLLMYGDYAQNTVDVIPSVLTYSPGGYYNEAMWNGHYCATVQDSYPNTAGVSWAGTPEILTIQEADECENRSHDSQTLKYRGYDTGWSGSVQIIQPCAIRYDPLIAWGRDVGTRAQIRGQIYDSLITSRSIYADMTDSAEPIITLPPSATYEWKNFTDRYYWGALWLLVPKAGGGGIANVAY